MNALPRNTVLEKVDFIIVKTTKLISYISGVCLIVIMLVAFFNVLGEKLRSLGLPVTGIPASTEIVSYLHIPVVFLAAAYVTFDRGHTRIDLITSKLNKVVQNILLTFGYILGVGICSFISWRGFIQMGKFIARNKMSSVTGVGFPLWPFALIMSVGFAILAIAFIWSIVRQYAMKEKTKTSAPEPASLKGGAI